MQRCLKIVIRLFWYQKLLRGQVLRAYLRLLIVLLMFMYQNVARPNQLKKLVTVFLLWKKISSLQPIRQRLNSQVYREPWKGEDRLNKLFRRPYEFFQVTGETQQSFFQLFEKIQDRIPKLPSKISQENKLCLVLMWLRCYPNSSLLSSIFLVSITDISRCLRSMWPLLLDVVKEEIKWPTRREWTRLKNSWPDLPGVVGAIDGTSHKIQKPLENQRKFYSGCRKYHCVHSQILIDSELNIRYVSSGFYGHLNDAQTFRELPEFGEHNLNYYMPPNCWVLADKIYPCIKPLITPYRKNQIPKNDLNEARRRNLFNDLIVAHRVYVEHVIGRLKQYRIIGSVYRHDITELGRIVYLCACLTQRRVELLDKI